MSAAAIEPMPDAQAQRPARWLLRVLFDGRDGDFDGWISGVFLRDLFNMSVRFHVIQPARASDVLAGLIAGGFIESCEDAEDGVTSYRIKPAGVQLIEDMRTFEAARGGCPTIWGGT